MKVLAFTLVVLVAPPLIAETVLLDFTADWCQPCRAMAPIVAGLEQEGYRVRRVNVSGTEQERALARQYKVQSIPTFVVLTDGRETDRWGGLTSAENLRRMLGPVRERRKPQSDTAVKPRAGGTAPVAQTAGARTPAELARSSVRIVVDDAKGRSFATGTVIQSGSGETLVLSCSHLFDGIDPSARATVDFLATTPPSRHTAELVTRDRQADLSLLRIRTDQVFPVARVASRQAVLAPGSPVTSVGCDNGGAVRTHATRVTAVNRYLGWPNVECAGQPVQGRSGGGLFNSSGELIGVCTAAEPAEQKGIYAALSAIHALLDRQGLARLCESSPSRVEAAPRRDAQVLPASLLKKPAPPVVTLPPPGSLGIKGPDPAAMPQVPADAEVVCVVRPRETPQDVRVFVLKQATPELIGYLEKAKDEQPPAEATAMRVAGDAAPSGPKQPAPTTVSGAAQSTESPGWRRRAERSPATR